jgi:hypothetical protein
VCAIGQSPSAARYDEPVRLAHLFSVAAMTLGCGGPALVPASPPQSTPHAPTSSPAVAEVEPASDQISAFGITIESRLADKLFSGLIDHLDIEARCTLSGHTARIGDCETTYDLWDNTMRLRGGVCETGGDNLVDVARACIDPRRLRTTTDELHCAEGAFDIVVTEDVSRWRPAREPLPTSN